VSEELELGLPRTAHVLSLRFGVEPKLENLPKLLYKMAMAKAFDSMLLTISSLAGAERARVFFAPPEMEVKSAVVLDGETARRLGLGNFIRPTENPSILLLLTLGYPGQPPSDRILLRVFFVGRDACLELLGSRACEAVYKVVKELGAPVEPREVQLPQSRAPRPPHLRPAPTASPPSPPPTSTAASSPSEDEELPPELEEAIERSYEELVEDEEEGG